MQIGQGTSHIEVEIALLYETILLHDEVKKQNVVGRSSIEAEFKTLA